MPPSAPWAAPCTAPTSATPAATRRSMVRMGVFLSADRVVNGNELGPVGERGFDLDLGYHLGDAVLHLGAAQHPGAVLHQGGDAAAVARALHDEVRDQRHRLG